MTFQTCISKTNFLAKHNIGIIGCGHLGQSIAKALLEQNFPVDNLRVSFGGNPVTLENLKQAGLLSNITSNAEICLHSHIIFITVRPQDCKELKNLPFPKQATIVSCMAGISIATLRKILGVDVFRIMPSSPDTIIGKKGIVALYPENDMLENIFKYMNLSVYHIFKEDMLHTFTTGVCLPAAILAARKFNLPIERGIKTIEEEYPGFKDIYQWAINVLPIFGAKQEQEEYIAKMLTKGGITETIVNSIYAGDEFLIALKKGIARSKKLAERANELEYN